MALISQTLPGVKCCTCGGTKSPWDMFLPITYKGSFFQDSFFSSLHQHFDAAVREILNQWSDWDDMVFKQHTDILDRYRRLRSRNLKQENQAIAIASDDNSCKVVMDVHDFMGGDVKVKVVGEKELVVEGRVDKADDDSAARSPLSFRRRFALPRFTDLSAISSVMSSDGVLTVSTPTTETPGQHKTTIIPIQLEESETPQPSISSSEQNQFKCERCTQEQVPKTTNTPTHQGINVPIQNYGSQTKVNQGAQDSGHQSRSKIVPIVVEGSEGSPPHNRQIQPSECQLKPAIPDDMFQVDMFPGSFFPIMRRGPFFNDSFFQDCWNDFNRAVNEVLSRWGDQPAFADPLTSYRNLRSRDLREDTQAVTSSEDERQHKFVIDVKDFTDGGEIKVKAVNDREVVVEGQLKKQGDGSKSAKRFLRRFVTPQPIQLDAVKSVMSADGVLTITAPKKESTLQIEEVFSPVCGEASECKTLPNVVMAATPGTTIPSATSGVDAPPSFPKPSPDSQNTSALPFGSSMMPSRSEGQSSASYSPGNVASVEEDSASKASSVKGKGFIPPQSEEENVDYKAALKPRSDGKFPIKISGTVINSNAV